MTAAPPVFAREQPGTPEERWRAVGFADRAAPLELAGVDRLVVLSAHPDDEALGAAGLIRRLATREVPIEVIVASDGEGSHPGSPTHPPDLLAARRRSEMTRALVQLAPRARLRRLGLPDGSLAAHPAELVAAVRGAVGPAAAGTLLATPWRDDRHPDHEAVARAAEQVAAESGAALIQFPIWAWHWAAPDDPRLHRSRLSVLPLTADEHAAKLRAIREHRSQVAALGDDPADRPMLDAPFLAHFHRPFEVFLPVVRSLPGDYFDALYRESDDPWRLGRHWYEHRKRTLTVAALTRPRFASAFEPGCATGLLTELLAPRCDRLLATDIAAVAVEAARRRVAGHPQVEVQRCSVPEQWPDGAFDLVVLSEIGYYCDRTELSRLIDRTVGALARDGVVVACHWRHPARGYPLTGDQVHAALLAESGLSVAVAHREEDFRLDVLSRPGAPSVARWEGVLA